MSHDPAAGLAFVKAHGTGNDFVLLPDPDGQLDLTAELAQALCDRRFGLGSDGVIRIVRTSAATDAVQYVGAADFFMDYRNSDGSLSQMCGNGARVFARYLVEFGLVESAPAKPSPVVFATRGGVRSAVVHEGSDQPPGFVDVNAHGWVSVSMGHSRQTDGDDIRVHHHGRAWTGRGVWVPNPHVVVMVDDLAEVGSLEQAPVVDAATFPEGANVEFVDVLGPRHVAMRVHERGSGETLSCGTGACAVAVSVAQGGGVAGPVSYRVDVPGGALEVAIDAEGEITLSGPTEFVASGVVPQSWLAHHGVGRADLVGATSTTGGSE